MTEPTVFGPASRKQEKFLNSDSKITLCGGAAGSGKALLHGEKVLTPNGFVNIENIEIGDYVVTPKNTIESVIGVYPQGEVDIYEIEFYDGRKVRCCGNHLWEYRLLRDHRRIKRTSTTLEIIELMKQGKRIRIPLINPVEFGENKELPIKPYTLGVLLGDGSITTNSISFITLDDEITDNVMNDGYSIKRWQLNEKRTEAKTYGVHGVSGLLRDMNLLGTNSKTKFIPTEYLSASIDDRYALLQGLMDTDGSVTKDCGTIEYSTSSKQLAYNIVEILHSLGHTAKIATRYPKYKYKGESKTGSLSYRIYINGGDTSRLFRLKRKLDNLRSTEPLDGLTVESITKVERGEATCISVSGEDKLFVTTGYVVTHNTYVSLLIALKFMQHPRATGVIFRRTSPMLTAPGSIWHEAVNLYQTIYPKGLKIRSQEKEIIFPNGALLKFSHMQYENDKYSHKGGQYSLVIFDEATDFTETQIVYLISRMRNAYVNYTPQMFLMTNPDYNSFLRFWIQDYYLDIRGIPIEERAGHKRFYFRQGNTMVWYSSLEEAEAVHGAGDASGIGSFTFIGANCRDNPPLLKAQPDYISNLMNLERVERERLLDGSWFARTESSGLFKREWCKEVPFPNMDATKRVRSWDFAFSKPSEQYPNPDWTRGVLMSKGQNEYTIEDVVGLRDRVHEVEKLIFMTAERDGRGTTISIPQDPNASAAAYAKNLQRRLAEMGYNCRLMRPVKSKLLRFAPFSSVAQAGFVSVVQDVWNKEYYEELEAFSGERNSFKDDQVDCCSDAITVLNMGFELPTNMSMPDLTRELGVGNVGFNPSVHNNGQSLIPTLTF